MSIGQSTSLVHTGMSQQLLDELSEGITLLGYNHALIR